MPWLLASVPAGLLLNFAVKSVLHRTRPESDYVAERLSSFSFPSGHTAGATLLYGFLALCLWRRNPSLGLRAAVVAGAAILVAMVATSRVMLGMHYPSDCVAAIIEGVAWLAICLVAAGRSVA